MAANNNDNIKRLGIMGGTFDPVHYGHLVAAEAALHDFSLQRVIFIPSARPPHKKDTAEAIHRYHMTSLAVASNPRFEVSRIEIDRSGYSYTIDTMQELRQIFGRKTELFFIAGADTIQEIPTWKDVGGLMDFCSFIVSSRPGFVMGELKARIAECCHGYEGKFHLMEVPHLDISSTDIRQRVKEGRPIKYLLPESVEAYIFKNALYKKIFNNGS